MLTWATSSQRMQPPSNPGRFTDVLEPNGLVDPRPFHRRLAFQLHTEFGEERFDSRKVVDNDENVVHSPNRHIPSIGLEVPLSAALAGEAETDLGVVPARTCRQPLPSFMIPRQSNAGVELWVRRRSTEVSRALCCRSSRSAWPRWRRSEARRCIWVSSHASRGCGSRRPS